MMACLALIHSPLVGPYTWEPVADALRTRGVDVRVPTLARPTEGPFWQAHARSAAGGIGDLPDDARVVLAGHSGAGALLPAIARALGRPIAAYIYVDAGLPHGGRARMAGAFGDLLRDLYARGECFPNWTDEALAGLLPDAGTRARVMEELRPQPLAFWEEPLPEIDGWQAVPSAYLHFSSSYDEDMERARALNWPAVLLPAGHFHMLVEPEAVAGAMVELLDDLDLRPQAVR